MLTGSELLAKVKELGDCNKTDIVRACGYIKDDKVCFTAFYEALLEAKGIMVGNAYITEAFKPGSLATTGKKTGRKLSYKTKVQFNGNLDEFEIKVSRNSVTLTAA